jgi:hypothetical protein
MIDIVRKVVNSPGLRFESLSGMISYFHELANVDLGADSAS